MLLRPALVSSASAFRGCQPCVDCGFYVLLEFFHDLPPSIGLLCTVGELLSSYTVGFKLKVRVCSWTQQVYGRQEIRCRREVCSQWWSQKDALRNISPPACCNPWMSALIGLLRLNSGGSTQNRNENHKQMPTVRFKEALLATVLGWIVPMWDSVSTDIVSHSLKVIGTLVWMALKTNWRRANARKTELQTHTSSSSDTVKGIVRGMLQLFVRWACTGA